ncbi:MAG: DUF6371 domain-containing protein [Bacteroidales bacterium]|jgi:hypothetical protein|nr:DUF6371 domain-containing protein [Bacteroidales bacterium]
MRYNLEKYHGPSSKHTCPKCGRSKCFVYYVDNENNNQIIDPTCGKCDHIQSCGYHLSPKDYFAINKRVAPKSNIFIKTNTNTSPNTSPNTIPTKIFQLTTTRNHHFKDFLLSLFDEKEVNNALVKYHVTGTKDYKTIFWQTDYYNNIHSGKIIDYNPIDGHRVKDKYPQVQWVHNLLIKQGLLTKNFTLKQCLFGEHLLRAYNGSDKIVVVESEKTAIIMSIADKSKLWLACGGLQNINKELFRTMTDNNIHHIILLPDKGCCDLWTKKKYEIENDLLIKLTVSKFIEKIPIIQDGEDIADLQIMLNNK